MTIKYPTIEEVEKANMKRICYWYKNLPTPKEQYSFHNDSIDIEHHILNRIIEIWNSAGALKNPENRKIYFSNIS